MVEEKKDKDPATDPSVALTDCMLSQYAMTFAGVSSATGYAVWKKPKKGMQIMVLAGVAGTVLDLAYGWTSACKDEVDEWRRQPGS